jgi:hypothetical protein
MALPAVARIPGVGDHRTARGWEWGYSGHASRPNIGLELTAYSVRSCLAVRRNSSNRIPEESGEDLEDIL